jgi:peptidoglycan hydrolase-like protein with peptidoglycan-binding domain
VIQQERAIEADVYARINIEGEINADSVKAALEADPEGKKLLCQLQADLKILKNSDGNAYYTSSIDGKFGPGTTRAVNGAIEQYGSLTAIRRAARLAEVVIEAERNNSDGRTNQ